MWASLFVFRNIGPIPRGTPRLSWRTVTHALILRSNRSSQSAVEVETSWPNSSALRITWNAVPCVSVTGLWHVAGIHTSEVQSVAKFVNLDAESFVSLECISEQLLFTCTARSLRPQQDVLSDCTFLKICCSECQKPFLFPKSVVVCDVTVRRVVIVFKMEKSEECGRSNHLPSHLNNMEYSTASLWTNNLWGCQGGRV